MAHVFKEGKMLSNVADTYLANAISAADLPDGSLVTLGALVADTTYTVGGVDPYDAVEYDTYVATAPAAATDPVVLVDYAGISDGDIAGNNYKMGIKLYNLTVKAGQITRVRYPALHDKYWVGDANFDTTPTVGQYATAAAGVTTHKAAASLPASGYAVKVLASKDLTAGMASQGTTYLCEVVQL